MKHFRFWVAKIDSFTYLSSVSSLHINNTTVPLVAQPRQKRRNIEILQWPSIIKQNEWTNEQVPLTCPLRVLHDLALPTSLSNTLAHSHPALWACLFLKHYKFLPVMGHLYFLALLCGEVFPQATKMGMLRLIRHISLLHLHIFLFNNIFWFICLFW